jgi:sugar lactone lactonase YvrE
VRPRNRLVIIGGAVAAVAVAAFLVQVAIGGGPGVPAARGGDDATWTTVFKSTFGLEGLTGDNDGFLYSADRGGSLGCRVWRVPAAGGAAVVVGHVAPPCSPSGLTFDATGKLYITGVGPAQDQIWSVLPSATTPPPEATPYATGVPIANGIAFDASGALWAGDGTNNQGIVWRVPPGGGKGVEAFRVPPTANSVGIGRQNSTVQPPVAANPQGIAANGVAFTEDGTLLVADTSRGAIWSVAVGDDGIVASPTGCDSTYTADTLCVDDLLVENPLLEGADGFALDRAGNIWTAANERTAIVVVSRTGRVEEFFRNPLDAVTHRRNSGPLEFPTSPFLLDKTLCVTQSDGNRRDNSPNSAGEVGPGTGFAAKISCLDQRLQTPGLPLPVGQGNDG